MINEIIFMKGYGLYVWSAFSFTLISFATLYILIKSNLVKEQNKFVTKFGLLDKEKVKVIDINDCLEKVIKENNAIDILKIDNEGEELKTVSSINK